MKRWGFLLIIFHAVIAPAEWLNKTSILGCVYYYLSKNATQSYKSCHDIDLFSLIADKCQYLPF